MKWNDRFTLATNVNCPPQFYGNAGWAETCTDEDAYVGLLDHNPNRGADYPGSVGENIFAASYVASGADAVAYWVAEKQYYDYDSNSCSRVCGHYTQVVWRETTKLGCGVYNCPNLDYNYAIVCNYAPAGNNGSRPY